MASPPALPDEGGSQGLRSCYYLFCFGRRPFRYDVITVFAAPIPYIYNFYFFSFNFLSPLLGLGL